MLSEAQRARLWAWGADAAVYACVPLWLLDIGAEYASKGVSWATRWAAFPLVRFGEWCERKAAEAGRLSLGGKDAAE